jgi:succinate-semialdehyde dehydrogenase / glutarate-semialdehyde dehydrogenase
MLRMDLEAARALLKDAIQASRKLLACRRSFDVSNPATAEVIASVPDCHAREVRVALDRADAIQARWAEVSPGDRWQALVRWRTLISESLDALAVVLTMEQGKPIAEAKAEILSGCRYLEWFAEEAKRISGEIVPPPNSGVLGFVIKRPVGVVAAITPWNFPCGMMLRKVAPALAAGCAVIAKPAEQAPLSALLLQWLANEAGLPRGVFQVLPSSQAAVIGESLMQSPVIRKLSFTGSTRTGKVLIEQSAATVKLLSLELGGNAPFIVFPDANLDSAVSAAIRAKFRNAGQVCIAANRIYVHAAIADSFLEKFAAAVSRLKLGNGLDSDTDIGPLINGAAIEKIESYIRDALRLGGRLVLGGSRSCLGPHFFQPTILLGEPSEPKPMCDDEIFGPVAHIFHFSDHSDILRRSNNTRYGLAAYIWTENYGKGWRLAESLEFGMVGINDALTSNVAAPFGGLKESGIGREGSALGIDEYLERKYISVGCCIE